MSEFNFKKGMKVVNIIHTPSGHREATVKLVTKVSKGVVYLDEEEGITYDSKTGKELENFFPGFSSEITPIEVD